MIHAAPFLRARLAEMQLAVMLLTRLPAGKINDPAPAVGAACWAFPLIGLIVGVDWGLFAGLDRQFSPPRQRT